MSHFLIKFLDVLYGKKKQNYLQLPHVNPINVKLERVGSGREWDLLKINFSFHSICSICSFVIKNIYLIILDTKLQDIFDFLAKSFQKNQNQKNQNILDPPPAKKQLFMREGGTVKIFRRLPLIYPQNQKKLKNFEFQAFVPPPRQLKNVRKICVLIYQKIILPRYQRKNFFQKSQYFVQTTNTNQILQQNSYFISKLLLFQWLNIQKYVKHNKNTIHKTKKKQYSLNT
eukprot:TRINITY_DN348_c1_g3_i6.p1 TRINITY_DN348_c1_g3~~TRINITY_DN348_c1_g3_i6.p1  ORF type:complete len:229 (-),score=4.30 TRINITY_DN348_c1_g3_i6:744-1430(-)